MSTEKKNHIGTYVADEWYGRIVQAADQQDRSMSSFLRMALRREVYRHSKSGEFVNLQIDKVATKEEV